MATRSPPAGTRCGSRGRGSVDLPPTYGVSSGRFRARSPVAGAMRESLTPKQHWVFEFVRDYIETHGYAPTFEEIRDAAGVSALSTVYEHVESLAAKKYLRFQKGSVRSIQLIPEHHPYDFVVEAFDDVAWARVLLAIARPDLETDPPFGTSIDPAVREEAARTALELLGPAVPPTGAEPSVHRSLSCELPERDWQLAIGDRLHVQEVCRDTRHGSCA